MRIHEAWTLFAIFPSIEESTSWREEKPRESQAIYIKTKPDRVSIEEDLLIEESYDMRDIRVVIWSPQKGILGQGWISERDSIQDFWIASFVRTRFPPSLERILILRLPEVRM